MALSAGGGTAGTGTTVIPTAIPEDDAGIPGAVCGNGVREGYEACDSGGATAECDADCTLVECGDGVVNEAAGERCENLDEPWMCQQCQLKSCAQPTPWEQISNALKANQTGLPNLPDELLPTNWAAPVPSLRMDWIRPIERDPTWTPDPTVCDPSPWWPDDRVHVGPLVQGTDGDHCRMQFRADKVDETALMAITRYPMGSIHVPITGEPAWVRLRFPVPEGHDAISLTYEYNWARLFGSDPDPCHPSEQDENGTCAPQHLAEGEDWDDDVPAGLFLLWGRGEDCDGWLITGPHPPAANIGYSSVSQTTVEVPETFRNVDELVVAALVYHQYPGGCDGTNCLGAQGTYFQLGFKGAMLRTEAPFAPAKLPPFEHPRLFGSDAAWLAEQAPFDQLPCRSEPDYPEGAGWGSATNVRNIWDQFTKGGASCKNEVPTALVNHPDAADYLDGTAATNWNIMRALRVLHLVRRIRACHAEGQFCEFSLTELDPLVAQFISIELDRFAEWSWSDWPFGFDLRTEPTMRYWSLFVDTLWDDLSVEQHDLMATEMGERIDDFLGIYDDVHWALYNGNNWTPVLAKAALYWAITYYFEDPRAAEVAHRARQILWLHRDFYGPDGAYYEGLMMYTAVSFESLLDANRLASAAFGEPLQSVRWERMALAADWTMAYTAPDGLTVDFGDSWAKRGWGSFMPLYMKLHPELTGQASQGNAPLDACFARSFFANKYYDHGMRDPWVVHPALARDWPQFVQTCAANLPAATGEVSILDQGGWGAIRFGRPGATTTATLADNITYRHEQADQTFLAISAIPNERPHTELDFGSIVWTAYGNRLLSDLGYGTIDKLRYRTEPNYVPDNNPTGHNTLVVPEALQAGVPSTNTSQIDKAVGSIAIDMVDNIEVIHLDGSAVYGRDHPSLGWLEAFDRRVVPLTGGHFAIIDSFEVRSDRPDSMVQEYWYSTAQQMSPDPASCSVGTQHVNQSLVGTDRLKLEAVCASLVNGPAESVGLIVSDSMQPGGFVLDPPISFQNRVNYTDWRARARFVPDAPVRQDLRLFALVSSTSVATLPSVTLEHEPCGSGVCFSLAIDAVIHEFTFTDAAGGYALTGISTQ